MITTDRIDAVFERSFTAVGKSIRPKQREVIESVLAGNNTLALMPTGSGKSLCYWISGKALGGITLVIFPLKALMDEQAEKLTRCGCRVTTLHSGISSKEQYKELISLYSGQDPDFIFLSPERLGTDGFLEFVLRTINDRIKLVVIDEAHCISQWGPDFRPFYQEIPPFLANVFSEDHKPIILGLTATLCPKDVNQICADFNIAPASIIQNDQMLRHEISLKVIKVKDENEKDAVLWQTLDEHREEKLLVYVDRREGKRSVTTLSEAALEKGFKSAHFHGLLSSEEKLDIINRFKTGELQLVFATSAFGMGIDIPDIRGVIHYLLPESIEQYYQQIGRAGRDKKPSWALLLYSDKNVQVRKDDFIAQSFPKSEDIQNAFNSLSNGNGKVTFNYFEDETKQSAYHYLVRSGTVSVLCKGMHHINVFRVAKGASAPEFDSLLSATKTGILIATALKSGITEAQVVETIYRLLAERKILADRAPAKCLVVRSAVESLPEQVLAEIMEDVQKKKDFKFAMMDQFVKLLDDYSDSQHLHQEIGVHLGVDRFSLGRIYEALSGDMVRSKSEVIITNILFERGISFNYEQTLYADGKPYSPDFTIEHNGQTYYWEHLGLLEQDQYNSDWKKKEVMYNTHFPGQLIKTVESSVLSREAEGLIEKYFR